jgi:hypothetical protein
LLVVAVNSARSTFSCETLLTASTHLRLRELAELRGRSLDKAGVWALSHWLCPSPTRLLSTSPLRVGYKVPDASPLTVASPLPANGSLLAIKIGRINIVCRVSDGVLPSFIR